MEGNRSSLNWAYLPSPVLAHIFSFIPTFERDSLSLVCRNWNQSLDNPMIWKRFVCSFFFPEDIKVLRYVKRYGLFVTHLVVELNQIGDKNRENAVKLLGSMSELQDLKLTHLSVRFKGENPLFYAGVEFTLALSQLFQTCGKRKEFSKLTHLNLSGLQANFTDAFIDSISVNCPNITYLNILNKMLICNVPPICIKRLVQHCRKLRTLHAYHISINDSVLESFTEKTRTPLLRLGIVCRREEKCSEGITSEAWAELLKSNPDLTVELGFDHTCPFHRIAEIMKPEIPVVELHLATFTRIYSEIEQAVRFYDKYLERLVVQTRPSKELDRALLRVAEHCTKLRVLCVYCLVDKTVVDKILSLCPDMKQRGSYILKYEMEPEPWTVGKEEGD